MAASIKCRVHVFPAPGVETRATGFENVLGGANEMSQFWLGGLICELFVVVSFLDSVVVVLGGTVELLETVEINKSFVKYVLYIMCYAPSRKIFLKMSKF